MPIYKLKLVGKHQVANDTFQFDFEKPQDFKFIPGQYGGFALVDTAGLDANNLTRRFSILSTPQDKLVSIATRAQQSPYKKALNHLAVGQEIKFAGPTGKFILNPEDTSPIVMIAGGIGITPFYSILRDAFQQHSSQSFYLFYGNQSQEDAAYLDELQQLEREHAHFKFIPTLANANANWHGENGFITDDMIKKHIRDLAKPIYFVCGSPAMVKYMHETLTDMGIPEDRINTEDFPGY